MAALAGLCLVPIHAQTKSPGVPAALADPESPESLGRPNVRFVDSYADLIAGDDTVRLTDDGRFLYRDDHHLSGRGAVYIFEKSIRPAIEKALAKGQRPGPAGQFGATMPGRTVRRLSDD
jgi:hypothetical protein